MDSYGPEKVTEPDQLRCPITHALFRDPVFVPGSGNTYDRESLCKYWETLPQPRDPLTNIQLSDRVVHTNWGVRREVQRFLDAHPGYVPQGWPDRLMIPPAPQTKSAGLSSAACTIMRGPYATFILVAIAVLTNLVISSLMTSRTSSPSEVIHDEPPTKSSHVPFELPPKPADCRIEATMDGDLLTIRSPRGSISIDTILQILFASIWLCISITSTISIVRGRAPWAVGIFLLAFWGSGANMVANIAMAVCGTEVLEIDTENLVLSSEAFGFRSQQRRSLIADLHGPPLHQCQSQSSCYVIVGEDDFSVGAPGKMRSLEAEWTVSVLAQHLSIVTNGKIREPRRSRAQQKRSKPRRNEQSSGSPFGLSDFPFGLHGIPLFGGFAFGPGFAMFIR